MVRGPRFKHIGPWSTDLEPRIGDLGSGVTWASCWIWIELGRGVGRVLAGLAAQTADRDGLVKSTESDFVWACHQLQILPPQPTARKIRKPLSD